MALQQGNISIHAQNIMPIIKRWLYSDKDIFIRELVSNGCDAITKQKMLAPGSEEDYKVTVTVDEKTGEIRFSDNGIGMTAEEVEKYINQVAFSGAEEFLKNYEGDEKGGIIGHFGLGFYSAFMVADQVTIETQSGSEGAAPVRWVSEDGMAFTMAEGSRTRRGTDIILHIAEEEKEFTQEYRVREVLYRYCGFMNTPVYLEVVKEEPPVTDVNQPEGEAAPAIEVKEPVRINPNAALWLKAPKDCTEEEYKQFYRDVFHTYEDPLFYVHLNVDYPFNLKGILYFPKLTNDFGTREGEIKLFSGQVFVADNIKEVIPEFLMLLKGVIDCPDLPLNVSRSFLQNDGTVIKLQSHIVKKVSDKLTGLFNTERESFEGYWDDIAPFVKFGCVRDEAFFEKVEKALLFKTCDGKYKTVEEYTADCKSEGEGESAKKLVYYTSDPAGQSTYIDLFRSNGIDPVVLDHVIDNAFISFFEYKKQNITFKRIDADVSEISGEHRDDEALAELIAPMDKDMEVKAAALTEDGPPALILLSEEERRMREMMKQWGSAGMNLPGEKKTFLFNTAHPLTKKLLETTDGEIRTLIAEELYDMALLGFRRLEAEEISRFMARTAKILERL